MPTNDIFINHTLTKEEFLGLIRARYKYTKEKIQNIVISLGLCFLVSLFASIFVDKFFWILFGITALFIFGLIFTLQSQSAWVKSPLNRNYYLPNQYIFDEYGMQEKNDLIEYKQKWAFFVGWQKESNYYLLFVDKTRFFLIPENAIASEQRELFKKLVEENIKPLPKR